MPLYLPTSARGFFGSRFLFERLLPFGDIGQNLAQALVLDNRGLIDLLQSVERPVRQVAAFVLDRKPSVGIIDHGDALAGEGTGELVAYSKSSGLISREQW